MNYILLGPEEGLKSEWLAKEKKRVLSAYPDAEIHQIFVGDDKGEDLDAILSQATLFSSFRFVTIKQYELRTGKDTFDKAIIDFLSSGQEDAEFVILSSEKSKSKINPKIANSKNVNIQIFWEMFDNHAMQTRGEDGNTLFQAIADCDIEHAESIASSIISADSQGAVKAYSVLVSRFRQLESFEMLRARGMSEKDAFDNADSLSPYPVFFPTKGIRNRDQAAFRKAAKNYPLKDTERIILYLGEMDEKIKNSSSEWIRIAFSSMLTDIILRKGNVTGINLNPLSLEYSL